MNDVRSINKRKEGWRQVVKQINAMRARLSGKDDGKFAFDPDTGMSNQMNGVGMGAAKHNWSDTRQEQIAVNSPGVDGEVVEGGLVIQGTGKRDGDPGRYVTKMDIENAEKL